MNNRIKCLLNNARRLIEVPSCAACATRLSPFPQSGSATADFVCFCPDCAEKWSMARSKMCPKCAEIAEKCTCTPKFFKKHQDHIPSLCFYSANSQNVPSKTVLTLKYRKSGELVRFLASEMAPGVEALLRSKGISPEEAIVTWMPRQKTNLKKYGFDHGERLASCLAQRLGIPTVSIFKRRGGKEQKKLDKALRRENAESSLILKKRTRFNGKRTDVKDAVKGKSVIIIDDIITTGATLRRGVLLTMPLKPRGIICATAAKATLEKE